MKDFLGRELQVGDNILYASSGGTAADGFTIGQVSAIRERTFSVRMYDRSTGVVELKPRGHIMKFPQNAFILTEENFDDYLRYV